MILSKCPPNLVNTADHAGCLPIHYAAWSGFAEIVQLLVPHANVNAPDRNGNTALIQAARNGNAKVGEILISHNADIHARGYGGFTALYWAVKKQHVEFVNLLLDHRADIHAHSEDGSSPLRCALAENMVIVDLLISHPSTDWDILQNIPLNQLTDDEDKRNALLKIINWKFRNAFVRFYESFSGFGNDISQQHHIPKYILDGMIAREICSYHTCTVSH